MVKDFQTKFSGDRSRNIWELLILQYFCIMCTLQSMIALALDVIVQRQRCYGPLSFLTLKEICYAVEKKYFFLVFSGVG